MFDIGMNSRLKAESEDLLQQAVEQDEQTAEKLRLLIATGYQAKGWNCEPSVIIQAESHAAGTNRRAVVTDRARTRIIPPGVKSSSSPDCDEELQSLLWRIERRQR